MANEVLGASSGSHTLNGSDFPQAFSIDPAG